jgi:hypothetical protein
MATKRRMAKRKIPRNLIKKDTKEKINSHKNLKVGILPYPSHPLEPIQRGLRGKPGT